MLRDSTVAAVVRTRPRATPLAMITMRKLTHGVSFVSHIWDAYGAPLGGPSGRRSSAIRRRNKYILNSCFFLSFIFCLYSIDQSDTLQFSL